METFLYVPFCEFASSITSSSSLAGVLASGGRKRPMTLSGPPRALMQSEYTTELSMPPLRPTIAFLLPALFLMKSTILCASWEGSGIRRQ